MEQTKTTDLNTASDRENLARLYQRAAELSKPGPKPAPKVEDRS